MLRHGDVLRKSRELLRRCDSFRVRWVECSVGAEIGVRRGRRGCKPPGFLGSNCVDPGQCRPRTGYLPCLRNASRRHSSRGIALGASTGSPRTCGCKAERLEKCNADLSGRAGCSQPRTPERKGTDETLLECAHRPCRYPPILLVFPRKRPTGRLDPRFLETRSTTCRGTRCYCADALDTAARRQGIVLERRPSLPAIGVRGWRWR